MPNTFLLVFALTLYAVMACKRSFIGGFILLTICGLIWGLNTADVMEKCLKRHSQTTCQHSLR